MIKKNLTVLNIVACAAFLAGSVPMLAFAFGGTVSASAAANGQASAGETSAASGGSLQSILNIHPGQASSNNSSSNVGGSAGAPAGVTTGASGSANANANVNVTGAANVQAGSAAAGVTTKNASQPGSQMPTLQNVVVTAKATANAYGNISLQPLTNDVIRSNVAREIDRRVLIVDSALASAQSLKKLSATSKAILVSELQSQQSALADEKTKIGAIISQNPNAKTTPDSAANVAIINQTAKSLASSYRLYTLVTAKASILASAETAMNANNILESINARVESGVSTASSTGKNMKALQSLANDFSIRITDSTKQASSTYADLLTFDPAKGTDTTFPANRTVQFSARSRMRLAAADIKAARSDLNNMRAALKAMGISPAASTATAAGASATVK